MRCTTLLLASLMAACASPDRREDTERVEAVRALFDYDAPAAARAANRLTSDLLRENAPPRTRHAVAALFAERHAESATARQTWLAGTQPRSAGIGADSTSPENESSAINAHLVASSYHAQSALKLLDEAGSDGQDSASAARLAIIDLVAKSRLGFHGEVGRTLARSPELLHLESALAKVDAWRLTPSVTAYLFVALHRHLRTVDPLLSYRFAVLALEGEGRFGRGVDTDTRRELERWITGEAPVRFVCPESGTPFLVGATRSPISGVPHLEYVPTGG